MVGPVRVPRLRGGPRLVPAVLGGVRGAGRRVLLIYSRISIRDDVAAAASSLKEYGNFRPIDPRLLLPWPPRQHVRRR